MAAGSGQGAATMFLKYGADVTDAIRGIRSVDASIVKHTSVVKQASDVWDGFTGKLAKVGLMSEGIKNVAQGVESLTSSIVDLAMSAETEARSQRQLGYYMERMTGQAGAATDQIEAFVEGLANTTQFTKIELRSGLQDLIRQYGSVTIAENRLTDATDLAASGYGSLSAAVHGLSSAFDSVALRRGIGPISGAAVREANTATGALANWSKATTALKVQLTEGFLPYLTKGVQFASKAIMGMRHVFALFQSDVKGPNLASMKTVWAGVFGTDMPAALQTLFDFVVKVGKRIGQFVDDISNADSTTSVKTAVGTLVKDIKQIVGDSLSQLGKDLDALGPIGLAIKIVGGLAAGNEALKLVGLGPNAIFPLIGVALQGAGFLLAAAGAGGVPVIAIALGVALGLVISNEIADAAASGDPTKAVYEQIQKYLVAAGLAAVIGGAIIGAPIVATIGLGIMLGIGTVKIAEAIGDGGGPNLDKFYKGMFGQDFSYYDESGLVHISPNITVDPKTITWGHVPTEGSLPDANVNAQNGSIQTLSKKMVADTAKEWGGGLNIDPVAVSLAAAMTESSFDPRAIGDIGTNGPGTFSKGLFQENNAPGNPGYGLSDTQLMDPVESTKRFLRRIYAQQQAGYSDPGSMVAAAQRPADPEGYARRINELYRMFQVGGVNAQTFATADKGSSLTAGLPTTSTGAAAKPVWYTTYPDFWKEYPVWWTTAPGTTAKPPAVVTPPPGGTTVKPPPGGSTGGGGDRSSSATLDDIYAAYARVTGGAQISMDYAKQILAQGFSYTQASSQNIFTGTLTARGGARAKSMIEGDDGPPAAVTSTTALPGLTGPAEDSGGKPVKGYTPWGTAYYAHGFEGIVSKPTSMVVGEGAHPERVSITPLGDPSHPDAKGGANGHTFVTNIGSIDGPQRMMDLQQAQARLIRLYGGG